MKIFFIIPFSLVLSSTLYLQAHANVVHTAVYRCPYVNEISYDINGKPEAYTVVNSIYVHWVDHSIPGSYKYKATKLGLAILSRNHASNQFYIIDCTYDDQKNNVILLEPSSNQLPIIRSYGNRWEITTGNSGMICDSYGAADQCKFLVQTS